MAEYYTPSIEDIKVGTTLYTSIVHAKKGKFIEVEGETLKFDIKDFNALTYFCEMQSTETVNDHKRYNIDLSLYKCKYLDKEDIESCGLKVEQKPTTSYNKGDFWLKDRNNTALFDWFSEDIKENIEFNGVFFTIKNKSELKQLMQWLNIS